MRSPHWKVFLRTPVQCLAAATALPMLALGLIGSRHDFDQPHLHVNLDPIVPTTVSMFASGNSTASVTTFNSSSLLGTWSDMRKG